MREEDYARTVRSRHPTPLRLGDTFSSSVEFIPVDCKFIEFVAEERKRERKKKEGRESTGKRKGKERNRRAQLDHLRHRRG